MNLLIFIPCFNESKNIVKVISSLPKEMAGFDKTDILVVDDGSIDNTSELAISTGVFVVRHKTNRGLGCAFKTGVNFAIFNKYDYVINIDGDGQFDVADIPNLLQPLISGSADMVTASRFINKTRHDKPGNMSLIKWYGNLLMSFLISSILGTKFYDVSCGFRAYTIDTLLHLNLQGSFTYTQESFLQIYFKRLRIIEIPINVKYFEGRKSRVAQSIIRYGINSFSIIFKAYRDYFSVKIFSLFSFLFFLNGVVFSYITFVYFIDVGKFQGTYYSILISVSSYILSLILFLGGVASHQISSTRNSIDEILYLLRKGK